MKTSLWLFLFISLLWCVLAFSCDKPPGNAGPSNEPMPAPVHVTRAFTQKTDSGVKVVSKDAVNRAILSAVEDGYQQAKKDAITSGYKNKLEGSNYTVLIPDDPCEPSTVQAIPSFKLRADNYDGSIFDLYNPQGQNVKDGIGIIWAAEKVESYDPAEGFVCPELAKNGTDYFCEHVLAFWNHRAYFDATATHTTKEHPILPETP